MTSDRKILTTSVAAVLAMSVGCGSSDNGYSRTAAAESSADATNTMAQANYGSPHTNTANHAHNESASFVTRESDGRLWVFRADAEELEDFDEKGELAKHVIRPKAGPGGVTLKAPDTETIDAYLAEHTEKTTGFVTREDDGRLWVFRADSEELKDFDEMGELAKHVIRPKAGPGGVTLKAPDTETVDAYLAEYDRKTADFVTREHDGRLWVFRAGSEELKDFDEMGELAKHVIRPKAGPGGVTLKAPDTETIDAYLATLK
ncbi:MAG: hypothetical protein ACOC9P_00715 [bacterium]